MREIEFRGKRLDNGEWVHGGYVKHEKRMLCPVGDRLKPSDIAHCILISSYADWNMPRGIEGITVTPETVGQYIGLKDANNNKIFEGDIVKGNGYDAVCVDCKGIISYPGGIGEDYVFVSDSYRVIGNIHDNPELLEAKP